MEKLIIKYLTETISTAEKKTLLNWIEESEVNKKVFMDYLDIWVLTGSMQEADNTRAQSALDKLHQRIDCEEQYTVKVRINRRKSNWIRVAIAASLIIVGVVIFYSIGLPKSEALIANNEIEFYTTGYKESVVLPDGSEVWLKADSKITYPSSFAEGGRAITLEGEAFFNIVKDVDRPFKVITSDFTITVLGTTFNVSNRSYNDKAQAVLQTGSIRVDDHQGNNYTLTPNQRVTYNRMSDSFDVDEVDAQDYVLWAKNELILVNENLPTILEKLSLWYDINIAFDARELEAIKLSLTVRDESLEEILDLMEMIAPIKISLNQQSKGVDVYKK